MSRRFSAGISPDALKRAGIEAPKATRRAAPDAGKKAESALYGYLNILGVDYCPQYEWGKHLEPPRKFVSDAAIPAARLLIEVDGRAHIAGYERFIADMERRRLATHAGWRILAYTPDEAENGTASLDIQKFLEGEKQ